MVPCEVYILIHVVIGFERVPILVSLQENLAVDGVLYHSKTICLFDYNGIENLVTRRVY